MMRTFFTIAALCFLNYQLYSQDRLEECEIISIDSTTYYYVIKAKSKQEFIIVSPRLAEERNGEQITIGKKYTLNLKSVSRLRVGEGDNDFVILSRHNMTIDDIPIIVNGKLPFLSSNLSGLYYIGNSPH